MSSSASFFPAVAVVRVFCWQCLGAAEVGELKKCAREVERALGRKILENKLHKEAVALAHEKN